MSDVLWSKDASGRAVAVWADGWLVTLGETPVAKPHETAPTGYEAVPDEHLRRRGHGLVVRADPWLVTIRPEGRPDWTSTKPIGGVVVRGLGPDHDDA